MGDRSDRKRSPQYSSSSRYSSRPSDGRKSIAQNAPLSFSTAGTSDRRASSAHGTDHPPSSARKSMKLDVPSPRGSSPRRKSSRNVDDGESTNRRERKEGEDRSKKSSRNDKERDKERNDETLQKRSSRNDKKDDTSGRRPHKDDTPSHISDAGKNASSHRDTPRYSSDGTKKRSDRSEKEESKSRVTTSRAPEPKISFFSSDDISQIVQLSHDQQDDEVRTLCKQALGFFCKAQEIGEVDEKAEIEFKKMLLKYELRINSYEMEYSETRKEIERVKQEKELVEAKRILMKDKLAPLLDQLDAARKKRKERMETENLALVVNRTKSQKDLGLDIQGSEEDMKATVEAQKEIERRRAIRYEALLGMGEILGKFEEQLKEDFSLGKSEDNMSVEISHTRK